MKNLMKIIITNNSGLPELEIINEVTRIIKAGLVTIYLTGPSYKARTMYKNAVIVCSRNKCSFTFKVERL